MKKLLAFLAIALAASLGTFVLYRSASTALTQVDLRLKDVRFRVRGKLVPDQRVVVAAIDGRSIKEIGRWPWSREVTAQFITGLKEYGAKVVALDMVFSEPQGRAQDAALAGAMHACGNVVLGYFFRNDGDNPPEAVRDEVRRDRVKLLRLAEGVTSIPAPEFRALDASIPRISAAALDQGFFNVLPDDDGLYRAAPTIALYDGEVYPSLALRALARYLGSEPMVSVASFGVSPVQLKGLELPVNEAGELPLNYYGPTGSFRTVSAADVIKRRLPAGALRDTLVFVGATEMGVFDLRATPFDPALPGVEIHATVAANALDRRFLTRDGRTAGIELAAIFLLPALLALLLNATIRTVAGLGWLILSAGSWLLLNQFLFRSYFLDLSIIYPVAPVFLAYLGGEAYRNLVVERKGRYLKKAFSSYLSQELVDEIVKNPDRLRLGGEKREVTVLFSDIRGFTTLSESLSPEDLVQLLNEYLSPMTRIVLEEKGTLDKFIGDAVMAIFNAPLDLPGHQASACRVALRMIARLHELNQEFARRGIAAIDIGVGINTGEAVVGNMGADLRFDYTAIGDNVNLASRLEGLTKYYGARIVVTGATREAAGDEFIFREIDLVRVKGKQKPVAVYELMVDNPEIIPPFAEGLKLYRGRDFAGALQLFDRLAAGGDGPAALYVGRCRAFLANPPDAGWDGAFVARSK
ncbi:MAG TPA: adenylate/guanylate cyclase domain-containing protein [Geomonas sp.]